MFTIKTSLRFDCTKCKNEIICEYKKFDEQKSSFKASRGNLIDRNRIEVIIDCKNFKFK